MTFWQNAGPKKPVYELSPLEERHKLLMAATLADIKNSINYKVRILNPFDEPRVLPEASVISKASEVEYIESVIPPAVDEKTRTNQFKIQQIQ